MNRDSKTKGGIVGISLNQGTVQRWILTAHDRAKTLQTCREIAGLYDADGKHHKDSSAPRMKKDDDDVHKVMDIIASWINPFNSRDMTEPLLNIASDGITDDLLTAKQKGTDALSPSCKRDCKQVKSICLLHYQNPACRHLETR